MAEAEQFSASNLKSMAQDQKQQQRYYSDLDEDTILTGQPTSSKYMMMSSGKYFKKEGGVIPPKRKTVLKMMYELIAHSVSSLFNLPSSSAAAAVETPQAVVVNTRRWCQEKRAGKKVVPRP